jgi:hypothetical protein
VVAVIVTRDWVVDVLTRAGFTDQAERARRELPDTMDYEELPEWGQKYGITIDELRSAMGGSP